MSSISVGKIIYKTLNDNEIGNKVHHQIYPLIAQNSTVFPFIVYRRTSNGEEVNKDKIRGIETAYIELAIASDKYADSVEIAELTVDTLEKTKGLVEGFNVRKMRMIDSSEDYIEDTYVQTIIIQIELI